MTHALTRGFHGTIPPIGGIKAGCLVDAFPVLSRLIQCLLAERRCDVFRCDEAKLHGAGDWASGFFVFSFFVFVLVVDFDCFVFFFWRVSMIIYIVIRISRV